MFFMIIVLGLSILGFLLYYVNASELDVKLFEAHERIMSSGEILSSTIFLTILMTFILVSVLILVMILAVSQKIAGPLLKFEMVAQEIGKGNFRTNVRLRKKDKVIHLQNAFENMLYNLNGKVKNFKRNYLKLKKMEDRIIDAVETSALSDGDKTKMKKEVADFLEEYNNNLESFSLRELNLARLQEPYICPVHQWIGICPDYSETKENKFKLMEKQKELDKKRKENKTQEKDGEKDAAN